MKSWLPTTLLLLYCQLRYPYIELDPWSVGELMTARTMPSVIGIIALLVLTFQIGKHSWDLRKRDQVARKNQRRLILDLVPRRQLHCQPRSPHSRGLRYFWPVHRLN